MRSHCNNEMMMMMMTMMTIVITIVILRGVKKLDRLLYAMRMLN